MVKPLDRHRRDSTLFQLTGKLLRDFVGPNHPLLQVEGQLDFAGPVTPLEERYCPGYGLPRHSSRSDSAGAARLPALQQVLLPDTVFGHLGECRLRACLRTLTTACELTIIGVRQRVTTTGKKERTCPPNPGIPRPSPSPCRLRWRGSCAGWSWRRTAPSASFCASPSASTWRSASGAGGNDGERLRSRQTGYEQREGGDADGR